MAMVEMEVEAFPTTDTKSIDSSTLADVKQQNIHLPCAEGQLPVPISFPNFKKFQKQSPGIIRNPSATTLISKQQENISSSPSSNKGGTINLDNSQIESIIEDDLYPDDEFLRRPRSQSLDSGAPLVPPPLSSALLTEELSSVPCSCNCGGNCCSGKKKYSAQGSSLKTCESENCSCCTCYIQPSSVVAVPFFSGNNFKTTLGPDTQLPSSGISIVHVGPASNSRKMQRNHYHSRKYDGNSVVRVRAQVMMRDDSTGGWVPMGGGGLSNVSVRKRKIHHEEMNDQPCKHEYLIYGRRISDQSVEIGEVVLQCTIKKDFEYNKVMPTFHHWKTGNKKFGLTFQTAADARAFDKGVRLAIEDLLDGISETSPLHQYNLTGDVGDDEVFMQLELPVDKNDSRSPAMSSLTSGRSPSPSQLLDSLDPVVTSGNFSTVSSHTSFGHQRPPPPQGRHMMQTQRSSPPSTINTGKMISKEPLSSSNLQDHNYYHIQYPLQQSPVTPKTHHSTSGDKHSHLHFQSTKSLQQTYNSPNYNGNAINLTTSAVIGNKQTELLSGDEYHKCVKSILSDPSDILVKGSPVTTTMSSLTEPQLQQPIKGQVKDQDYAYVKFLKREPPHEYSYPKYIDPTANKSNVSSSIVTTIHSSTTNTSGTPVMSSHGAETNISPSSKQSQSEKEDTNSQSSAVKDSPVSSNCSQSGGYLARHNNNGSRYKTKSHHHTSSEIDDKNLVSINDYTSYLVKSSDSGGSLSQLGGNINEERNSLVGSCCSGSGSSCSNDSKKSCSKKHKHHHHHKSGNSKVNCKLCSTGKPHSHHQHRTSSQTHITSDLESKSGKPAVYSPGGTPRSSGIPGFLGGQGTLMGGAGGSPTNAITLTCAHCRESFSADDNRLGDCSEAPSIVRKSIETLTCLNCAQALLYHCMSDSEGDYVHPCECSNADGHAVRRWIGLTLLSVLVPCLCCYVPLISCYRCGELCNVCGGRHQAS